MTIIRCVLEEEHPWNRSSNRLYPDYGVLSLFLPAFVEEKKILRPDATRFFFLWFIFPYHAGAPARNNRTTIYYTLQDQSMGKTRDLLLPRSFSSRKTQFFFMQRQLENSGCAKTTTLIIVSKTMLLPRQEIREEKLIVFRRVESEISSEQCEKAPLRSF